MTRQIIEFKADGQQLEMLTPFKCYAAKSIRYIEARFSFLGESWAGYDNIYAVWYKDENSAYSSEIVDGITIVPAEVLASPGILTMNLCANLSENNVLIARMTSFPVDVLQLDKTRA